MSSHARSACRPQKENVRFVYLINRAQLYSIYTIYIDTNKIVPIFYSRDESILKTFSIVRKKNGIPTHVLYI